MRYRDTRTGRWVSRATWTRSKAHGGTRYKRVAPKKNQRSKAQGPIKRRKKTAVEGVGRTPSLPALREYFFVVFWKYKKGTKQINRRMPETILTSRDGATEEELKKLYADWLIKETKWKETDVYRIVYQSNSGRQTEFRIVPSADPGSDKPAGTIQPNDTRAEYGPDGKGFKKKRKK